MHSNDLMRNWNQEELVIKSKKKNIRKSLTPFGVYECNVHSTHASTTIDKRTMKSGYKNVPESSRPAKKMSSLEK